MLAPNTNSLTIGCFASLCRGRISDILIEYSRSQPDLALGVREMSRPALVQALRSGEVELAVLPGPPPEGFGTMRLWSERIMVAMPSSHPLAGSGEIAWADLTGELFLLSRRDSWPDLHRFLAGRLADGASQPRSAIHDVPHEKLLGLVADGAGLSLISEAAAGGAEAAVTLRPISGEAARFDIFACWSEPPAPPVEALLHVLGRHG